MKTKLTLSVDKDLIQFARIQARNEKRSVSGMFSDFLIARRQKVEINPIVSAQAMVGSLEDYRIDDTKTAIRRAHAKKHLH